MVLFALENARRHCIMIMAVNFRFVLGLMDNYNAVENYFPINVNFFSSLSPSLFATCSVFSSFVLRMCKAQKNGADKTCCFLDHFWLFFFFKYPTLIIRLPWGKGMVLSILTEEVWWVLWMLISVGLTCTPCWLFPRNSQVRPGGLWWLWLPM